MSMMYYYLFISFQMFFTCLQPKLFYFSSKFSSEIIFNYSIKDNLPKMDTNNITGSIFCPPGSMRTVFPRINWRARTATIITGISIYTRSLISIVSYQKSLNIGNFYHTWIKNKPRPPKNTASTVQIMTKDPKREIIHRISIRLILISLISYNY